jgi:hypothetical protein
MIVRKNKDGIAFCLATNVIAIKLYTVWHKFDRCPTCHQPGNGYCFGKKAYGARP